MIYSKDSMKALEQLPTAPAGTHEMRCVAEAPSKKNPSFHWFLFKNNEYQIYFNRFVNQLTKLATDFGIEVGDDGSFDTEKMKSKVANITVGDKIAKDGRVFENSCLSVEPIVDEDSEIPF